MSLAVSAGVCWCLLASVGVLCCLEMSGGYLWGCLRVSEWYLGKFEVLGCVWGLSECPVLSEKSKLHYFGRAMKYKMCSPDYTETKCPDISFPKITGICNILDFLGPLEANYKTQSLGSPCSRQQHLTHTIDICLMEFFGRDFLLPVVVNGHGSKVQVGRSQVSFSFGHHCSV